MKLLTFENVDYIWSGDSGAHRISDISFKLNNGEKLGLFGRSGTGKSTILRLALGELQPASGRIEIDRKATQAVYHDQTQKLLPWLSAKDNAEFQVRVNKVAREKISRVCGLHGFGRRNATALSGGQKARTVLARTLMSNADMIFLDEPFVGVDVYSQEEIVSYMATLSDKTMIVTAHDPGLLIQLCNRVYCLTPTSEGARGQIFSRSSELSGLLPEQIRRCPEYISDVKRLQASIYD